MNFTFYKTFITKKTLLFLVFAVHLFFFFFNNVIYKELLKDPIVYYDIGVGINSLDNIQFYFYPGTRFMLFITMLFSKVLYSFEVVSFSFSMISFLPYYFVIKKNYEKVIASKNLLLKSTFFLFLFMPSIHLWTTSVYKEALVFPILYFLSERLYFYNQMISKKDWWYFFIFTLMFFIRPYLGMLFLAATILVLYSRISKKWLLIFCTLILATAFVFATTVFPNISSINWANKIAQINQFSKSHGAAIIDLEKTNFVERFFYMQFRPLFFDANTTFQWFYSLENFGFLCWFIALLGSILYYKWYLLFTFKNIYLVISILIWMFIASYIYNYGLASRMKVMIVPFFLLGIIKFLKSESLEKNY